MGKSLGGLPKSRFDEQFVDLGQKAFFSATVCLPIRFGSVTELKINKNFSEWALPPILYDLLPPQTLTPWTFLCEGFWGARSQDNATTRWMLWSLHFRRCGTISTSTICGTQLTLSSHFWRLRSKLKGPTPNFNCLKWSHSSNWLLNQLGLIIEVLIKSLHSKTSPTLIRHYIVMMMQTVCSRNVPPGGVLITPDCEVISKEYRDSFVASLVCIDFQTLISRWHHSGLYSLKVSQSRNLA